MSNLFADFLKSAFNEEVFNITDPPPPKLIHYPQMTNIKQNYHQDEILAITNGAQTNSLQQEQEQNDSIVNKNQYMQEMETQKFVCDKEVNNSQQSSKLSRSSSISQQSDNHNKEAQIENNDIQQDNSPLSVHICRSCKFQCKQKDIQNHFGLLHDSLQTALIQIRQLPGLSNYLKIRKLQYNEICHACHLVKTNSLITKYYLSKNFPENRLQLLFSGVGSVACTLCMKKFNGTSITKHVQVATVAMKKQFGLSSYANQKLYYRCCKDCFDKNRQQQLNYSKAKLQYLMTNKTMCIDQVNEKDQRLCDICQFQFSPEQIFMAFPIEIQCSNQYAFGLTVCYANECKECYKRIQMLAAQNLHNFNIENNNNDPTTTKTEELDEIEINLGEAEIVAEADYSNYKNEAQNQYESAMDAIQKLRIKFMNINIEQQKQLTLLLQGDCHLLSKYLNNITWQCIECHQKYPGSQIADYFPKTVMPSGVVLKESYVFDCKGQTPKLTRIFRKCCTKCYNQLIMELFRKNLFVNTSAYNSICLNCFGQYKGKWNQLWYSNCIAVDCVRWDQRHNPWDPRDGLRERRVICQLCISAKENYIETNSSDNKDKAKVKNFQAKHKLSKKEIQRNKKRTQFYARQLSMKFYKKKGTRVQKFLAKIINMWLRNQNNDREMQGRPQIRLKLFSSGKRCVSCKIVFENIINNFHHTRQLMHANYKGMHVRRYRHKLTTVCVWCEMGRKSQKAAQIQEQIKHEGALNLTKYKMTQLQQSVMNPDQMALLRAKYRQELLLERRKRAKLNSTQKTKQICQSQLFNYQNFQSQKQQSNNLTNQNLSINEQQQTQQHQSNAKPNNNYYSLVDKPLQAHRYPTDAVMEDPKLSNPNCIVNPQPTFTPSSARINGATFANNNNTSERLHNNKVQNINSSTQNVLNQRTCKICLKVYPNADFDFFKITNPSSLIEEYLPQCKQCCMHLFETKQFLNCVRCKGLFRADELFARSYGDNKVVRFCKDCVKQTQFTDNILNFDEMIRKNDRLNMWEDKRQSSIDNQQAQQIMVKTQPHDNSNNFSHGNEDEDDQYKLSLDHQQAIYELNKEHEKQITIIDNDLTIPLAERNVLINSNHIQHQQRLAQLQTRYTKEPQGMVSNMINKNTQKIKKGNDIMNSANNGLHEMKQCEMCCKVFPVNAQNFPVMKRKRPCMKTGFDDFSQIYYYRRVCIECGRNKVRKYNKLKRERRQQKFDENKKIINRLYAASMQQSPKRLEGPTSVINTLNTLFKI